MLGKALKVLAEVTVGAVSCPGVHLPDRDDVYLSLCVLGQYRQSQRLPAVFPLLLHEKMTFEKMKLSGWSWCSWFLQAGGALACFEDDARRFLFPEPKLVPSFSGMDRELLMTRVPHFPGIAPRLEFSSRTTITECSADAEVNLHPNVLMNPVLKRHRSRCGRSQTSSHQRAQTVGRRRGASANREGRGTEPRRSQSVSPVSPGNTQSLDCMASSPADWDSVSTSWPDGQISEDECGFSGTHIDSTHSQRPDQSAAWRACQERAVRSQSRSHRVWEDVHDRVRRLLTTPKALQRLVSGATQSEVDAVLTRISICPGPPW